MPPTLQGKPFMGKLLVIVLLFSLIAIGLAFRSGHGGGGLAFLAVALAVSIVLMGPLLAARGNGKRDAAVPDVGRWGPAFLMTAVLLMLPMEWLLQSLTALPGIGLLFAGWLHALGSNGVLLLAFTLALPVAFGGAWLYRRLLQDAVKERP